MRDIDNALGYRRGNSYRMLHNFLGINMAVGGHSQWFEYKEICFTLRRPYNSKHFRIAPKIDYNICSESRIAKKGHAVELFNEDNK